MWWLLIIFGVLGGILGGMGMGGGTLLIPLITIFTDIKQKEAQGINLIVFLPMAIIALIIHFKNKLVHFKAGIYIIITGVIFSALGAYVALSLKSQNLKLYFGIFLIALSIFQFISIFWFDKKSAKHIKSKKH